MASPDLTQAETSDTVQPPTQDEAGKQDEVVDEMNDEERELKEAAEEEAREKVRREREARAQALTLEIVGDLPYAEVKPPENVLFVCKLNPVTEDEDLDTIFSRFGFIVSCEVIRDKRTHDSLQYAFIEFENQKDCEQAYFKMQGVLIDDHRIHVDFSQSVSRLSDKWRTATNSKRAQSRGGFGGIASLEKKRQFRAADPKADDERQRSNGYGMVFDKRSVNHDPEQGPDPDRAARKYSRSRSPRRNDRYRERTPPQDHRRRRSRSRNRRRDNYYDRRRR
ncbi:Peptidyl-prolyl cis-trans isomerase cyp6 [Puttea exsequens]|nr:Peptidyl-prolyl cis-trans isomerase cyp6 [Puttea exsequens]